MTLRPAPFPLVWFHSCSIGLRSGEYDGSKNVSKRPSNVAMHSLTIFDLWEYLFFPCFHGLWISLISPIKRFLTGKPQLSHQAPHRSDAELDPALTFNQFDDHGKRPQRKFKFHLHWILVSNRFVYPSDLSAIEPFRTPATAPSTQRLPSTVAISAKPVVYASTTKSERFHHNFRAFTSLDMLNCSNSYLFHCLGAYLSSIERFHAHCYSIGEEKSL
jgi:hypothetical protein